MSGTMFGRGQEVCHEVLIHELVVREMRSWFHSSISGTMYFHAFQIYAEPEFYKIMPLAPHFTLSLRSHRLSFPLCKTYKASTASRTCWWCQHHHDPPPQRAIAPLNVALQTQWTKDEQRCYLAHEWLTMFLSMSAQRLNNWPNRQAMILVKRTLVRVLKSCQHLTNPNILQPKRPTVLQDLGMHVATIPR